MKRNCLLLLTMVLVLTVSCTSKQQNENAWLRNGVATSVQQLKLMAEKVKSSGLQPRSIKNGEVRLENAYDWTSGFFPGSLWLAYELTGDSLLKNEAMHYTQLLSEIQYYKGTHDLGFMIHCSYGNAVRLSGNTLLDTVIVNGAQSLISRFNPTVGQIRSWDFGEWRYPVIIDNMMNLEMLFYASKISGDSTFRNIAIQHANVTMKNHFRDDYSSYHVVSYNPETGALESQGTFQGYSDSSAWARGQAWGLYGYTMCYKETGDDKYLNQAKAIASFIMNNANSTSDLIPYWDFNAPNIPNAPRDASAAAVTASALLSLSTMVADGEAYFDYAETILKNLSSDKYLAKVGDNKNFILMHSVGHLPANSEIDVPLNYADYYYLEGLIRYAALKQINIIH